MHVTVTLLMGHLVCLASHWSGVSLCCGVISIQTLLENNRQSYLSQYHSYLQVLAGALIFYHTSHVTIRHECSAPAQGVLGAAILRERSIILLSCFIITIHEHKPCNKQYLYSILATRMLVCM